MLNIFRTVSPPIIRSPKTTHSTGHMPSLLTATASVGELLQLIYASGSFKQARHIPYVTCRVKELILYLHIYLYRTNWVNAVLRHNNCLYYSHNKQIHSLSLCGSKIAQFTVQNLAVRILPTIPWSSCQVLIYTGCPRGNVPDFGRMFLKLKYTDITQNTYIRTYICWK